MVAFLPISQKMYQLAERQHGHVTRTQLLGLGMGSAGVQHLLSNGALVSVHAGVYALGYRRRRPIERAHAAVLAGGPHAVLSHESAAAAYGLRGWPRQPEITLPIGQRRRRPGILIHRSRTLTRADMSRQYGLPVTTAARTILDVSPRLTDAELIQIVSDARRAGHLGPTARSRVLAGSPRIARLIDPGQAPSESRLMAQFLLFLRRHRLPVPLIEQPFHGFRVDAIYPEQRLIIELDGYEFHRDRAQFEADRARDAVALEHGFETFRITWRRLTQEPRQLAAQLRAILAARSPGRIRARSA